MEAWGTGPVCGQLDTCKVVAGTLRREGGRQGVWEDRDQQRHVAEIGGRPYMGFKIFQ